MRQAKALGYHTFLIFVALDNPELNVDRVRVRVSEGGHDVPRIDILRRYERSLLNAPEALRLADEAIVFENSGLSHGSMLLLRDGRITWKNHPLPDWVQRLASHFE